MVKTDSRFRFLETRVETTSLVFKIGHFKNTKIPHSKSTSKAPQGADIALNVLRILAVINASGVCRLDFCPKRNTGQKRRFSGNFSYQ